MDNSVNNDFYLGLDIGTDSVGWAVTDSNYKILRRKGKSMWGIRLFDPANTAAERRTFRTNRRRLQRRTQRIELLQELFADEMDKVDPLFFQRMKDSAYWEEDKTDFQIYSLFNDDNYTDVEYHKEFPTIYHLRKALLENDKAYDIRLVYLAIHHLMKNRGHFLFSGSIEEATSFSSTYNTFLDCLKEELNIELICDSKEKFEAILKNKKLSRTGKSKALEDLCHLEKTDKQTIEIFKLITGTKANLNIIFQDEALCDNEHNKISFSDSNYDDIRIALDDEIQEKAGIIDVFHSLYSWVILADILAGGDYNGQAFLSVAKAKSYDKHQEDLKLLKNLVREYCPERYKPFFAQNGSDNYCAYIGMYKKNGKKISVKKCSQEDFYKGVKKLLERMPQGVKEIDNILNDINDNNFMPLQVSRDNGVIPYQINKMELSCILKNAECYLPFLKEKDNETGYTVSEKILMLFEFRIPYYVGPLNAYAGENCWMVRKEEGEIRPWNFDKKIDRDQSAANFIQRMTNQCTYLTKEKVLPKYSLLYSEFTVLNELNNVKIRGEKLPVKLKQKIYKDLFKKYKLVTGKRLLDYLNSIGYDLHKDDLSGFDGNFKASLTSYIEFEKIFHDEINKYSVQQMIEDIILWLSLYSDDVSMLKRVIKQHYGDQITDEQLKSISRLKFQGWGRLSKRFLSEIEGADCSTGECMTIIQGLRNTQNNLMQLLSQQYTFSEVIEEENSGFHIEGEITYDKLVKDVVASPSVKRSVWQTIQITEEIKKVMGRAPKKIFVEMARGEEEKKRTVSRKDKLLDLYKVIDKETKSTWCEELSQIPDERLKSIKLYLYYTQMGKCMYSGETIDLSQLDDATIWDRDHIYPQSKTKDDSLDNLVLVKREINAKKSDGLISPEIQKRMKPMWRYLKDRGLISEKKYERLTRTTPLTDEELAGFINRQLVETRQSSKVIATLLQRVYDQSEIVYVKAGAVADFKNEYLDGVKVREMNDYHHAKDAYVNIVVGNVYNTKFTNNPLNWLKKNPNQQYSLNHMFDFDLQDRSYMVWKAGKKGSIEVVNNTYNRNDILFTRYSYHNKGGLFDQMPVKAVGNEEKENGLVPLKKGMETWKYGGYKTVTPSHFMLVESKDKKGKLLRTIESVPLYRVEEFEKDQQAILKYCKDVYGLNDPKVIIPCIKKNAKLIVNGFPMHLRGTTGQQLLMQNAVQLILNNDDAKYLKKIIKYLDENAQRKDKKTLLPVDSYRGITQEGNRKLYSVFIDKLDSKIYQNRPANPKDKLAIKIETFEELSLEEQAIVLGEILHLFQCKPVLANLTLIGESANVGKVQISKKISNLNSVYLISQSPAGLYENKIDLLSV